ncbi:protein RTA1 [Staphylotrichum tortipilum]|uniref:Protein RTA1 n=1 Tax=Staphylotrichum tortipilum TaxID=2831512 RepID=A0AAN6MV72_9PEZI|nr:protein RTA1 [Staphylotrichum longicolle]
MENGEHVPGSVYFYAPNKGAPVFFAFAFAVSGGFHTYQCIHYKSWRLTGLHVFCALLFTAGFIVREIGAFDYQNLEKYIVSTCLIYSAPPLLELANYNILGRILYYAPYHSPIHPGRVITTFTFISFIVEVLNGNGVAYSANQSLAASAQNVGRALLKAALVIQLGVLALFVLLAVSFHRRCLRAGLRNERLLAALRTLYASTALLAVRTVFRVAEYWSIAQHDFWRPGGIDVKTLSPAIRYEWFFWVFEASLMLVNHVLMNVRHPRRYLPKSAKTYLALDGVTEVTGPGYKDGRKLWVTVVDPFDVYGLVKGKDREKKFWEEPGAREGRKAGRGDVEAQV